MQNTDQLLFTCESKIDALEWRNVAKYFPNIYWYYVKCGTLTNLVLIGILAMLYGGQRTLIFLFLIIEAFFMIAQRIGLGHLEEKRFYRMKYRMGYDVELQLEFFEAYFIRKSETMIRKISYSDINRAVETGDRIYLSERKMNRVFILPKDQCSPEFLHFLKEKLKPWQKYPNGRICIKSIAKPSHPKLVKYLMIALFVAALASLPAAMGCVAFFSRKIGLPALERVKMMWIFWCWLPIPIVSIVLGNKYRNAGLPCKKNVVGGVIIACLLLLYGSFWFISR